MTRWYWHSNEQANKAAVALLPSVFTDTKPAYVNGEKDQLARWQIGIKTAVARKGWISWATFLQTVVSLNPPTLAFLKACRISLQTFPGATFRRLCWQK
jgi:hypothetical protein